MTSRSRYSRTDADELGHRRPVVHGRRSRRAPGRLPVGTGRRRRRRRVAGRRGRAGPTPARRRAGPSAASSTERTSPLRWENVCISQITPHFRVPNTSQKCRCSGSTAWPVGVGVRRRAAPRRCRSHRRAGRRCRTATTSRRTSRGPRSGRRGARAPSRAPTRSPSGPTMKLPLRKSPCTSAGGAVGQGRGTRSSSQRSPSSNAGCGSPSMSITPRNWSTSAAASCTASRGRSSTGTAWIAAAARAHCADHHRVAASA